MADSFESVEAVVIGAGVVGLACARALARAGREVIVLEAADTIGTETSSRNSEVIHAGIYYPRDSLKARLCVAGKRALYAYCEERGIGHRRCGKLIVATSAAQLPALERIQAQAMANGVTDLAPIDAAQARGMEPALRCVAALHSPSTGIIDSHGLMLALQGEAEDHGAMIAFRSPVIGGHLSPSTMELMVDSKAAPSAAPAATPLSATRLGARVVVNSAGLHAPAVAAQLEGFPRARLPTSYRCKGNYYTLGGRSPFSRLIYPVPEAAGLGVHITLDLAGQARFGPDVEWIAASGPIDYTVDASRSDHFYVAIRRYWPALPDGALQPGYAGVRPKLHGPGELGDFANDFVIQGPADHGVAGLVNLFGIESPGLTAALAIADRVAGMIDTL